MPVQNIEKKAPQPSIGKERPEQPQNRSPESHCKIQQREPQSASPVFPGGFVDSLLHSVMDTAK